MQMSAEASVVQKSHFVKMLARSQRPRKMSLAYMEGCRHGEIVNQCGCFLTILAVDTSCQWWPCWFLGSWGLWLLAMLNIRLDTIFIFNKSHEMVPCGMRHCVRCCHELTLASRRPHLSLESGERLGKEELGVRLGRHTRLPDPSGLC